MATGGAFVCAALRDAGSEVLFSVSGNQILPIYDAAHEAGLRIVHTRHESAASYAAAAYAEVSGRIGVALTSAGPGFLAGLQGVAAAATMELPLLYLSGDSSVTQRGMGAFQELDQHTIASVICKATFTVNEPAVIPEVFAAASQIARDGIPGPVHIALPGDVLAATARPVVETPAEIATLPTADISSHVQRVADLLAESKRPLLLTRPAAMRGIAGEHARSIARKLNIEPVVIEAPRGLADLKYASLIAHFPESDCALIVAPADFALGFLDTNRLATDGRIVLVDTAEDPPAPRPIDIALQTDPVTFLTELDARLKSCDQVDPNWAARWPLPAPPASTDVEPGSVHPLAVSEAVRAVIGPDDIIVLDGGEFCQWIRLGLRDLPNNVLWNGKIGAIGGALPMSVGAATAVTGRKVIAIMGDGGSGYHLSEFETMDRYGLPVVAIIGNDARWAAEWHLQIARYGHDRTFETELTNAHYEQVAMGFDAVGEHVTAPEGLAETLHEALGRTSATCVNVGVAALPSPAAMS